MGEVFLAEDERLSRNVALKLLPKEWCGDESRRQLVGAGRGRGETEPAGVGGHRGEQAPGDLRGDCCAQLLGGFRHQASGGLGLGVLEQFGPQVVAAEVMIQDDLPGLGGADHVAHLAQLGPGRGVEHHQHLRRCGKAPA